jgi:membrane protease YdiL (CAAX protease family)
MPLSISYFLLVFYPVFLAYAAIGVNPYFGLTAALVAVIIIVMFGVFRKNAAPAIIPAAALPLALIAEALFQDASPWFRQVVINAVPGILGLYYLYPSWKRRLDTAPAGRPDIRLTAAVPLAGILAGIAVFIFKSTSHVDYDLIQGFYLFIPVITIAEELFFRAVIGREISRVIGAGESIAFSAAMQATVFLRDGYPATAAAFAVSLLSAWLFEKTGIFIYSVLFSTFARYAAFVLSVFFLAPEPLTPVF